MESVLLFVNSMIAVWLLIWFMGWDGGPIFSTEKSVSSEAGSEQKPIEHEL